MSLFKKEPAPVKHMVLLQKGDGEVLPREAIQVGETWMAYTWEYIQEGGALLMPNGEVRGPSYIKRWFGAVGDMKGWP
jgi:hypothetical protein